MSAAKRLDGALISALVRAELRKAVQSATQTIQRPPCLAVVMVEGKGQSESFVRAKQAAARSCDMEFVLHRLASDSTQEDVEAAVDYFNRAEYVDGIITQLPLPNRMCAMDVIQRIDPEKDVDGLHPHNVGAFTYTPDDAFCPCTALGIRVLLDQYNIATRGKHVVVVGRSAIAGRPVAAMFNHGDATTTLCHRYTADLAPITRQGDILVCAAGVPNLITLDHVRRGAVVIDVGINVLKQKEAGKAAILVGDVNPVVADVASALTPVPGGVGPMTVVGLLLNTFRAYATRHGLPSGALLSPMYSLRPGGPVYRLTETTDNGADSTRDC